VAREVESLHSFPGPDLVQDGPDTETLGTLAERFGTTGLTSSPAEQRLQVRDELSPD
jgi:hypothetical protein